MDSISEFTSRICHFWKEHSFLSNFYLVPIEFENEVYPSVEHAYQASKTLDIIERKLFLNSKLSSGQSKKLGKKITVRSDWNDVKLSIMYELVYYKFNEYPLLRKKLLETGEKELIEGNWWNDTFWGVCKGVGENHLGKILMNVREKLK